MQTRPFSDNFARKEYVSNITQHNSKRQHNPTKPYTQNSGKKLFYLKVCLSANNKTHGR